MHSAYSPSAGVIHSGKRFIPRQCLSRTTRHTRHAGDRSCRTITGEMGGKKRAVEIFFLVAGRIDGEALGGMRHFVIAHAF